MSYFTNVHDAFLSWHFLQILALQDERRAAEVAREEAERARKREAEEDKLKMKAAIEREARLAERREAVRLARQQEAQVQTRNGRQVEKERTILTFRPSSM